MSVEGLKKVMKNCGVLPPHQSVHGQVIFPWRLSC